MHWMVSLGDLMRGKEGESHRSHVHLGKFVAV